MSVIFNNPCLRFIHPDEPESIIPISALPKRYLDEPLVINIRRIDKKTIKNMQRNIEKIFKSERAR